MALRRGRGLLLGEKLEGLFDVSRYEAVSKYTCVDWADALSFRRAVMSTVFAGKERKFESAIDPNQLLVQILTRPMGSPENEAPGRKPMMGRILPAVADMSVYDVWGGQSLFFRLPEAAAVCKAIDEASCEEHYKEHDASVAWDSFHEHCQLKEVWRGSISEVKVSVDLDATDEELAASFSEWLKKKRGQMDGLKPRPPTGQFTARDYADWTKKRLLPCIDLMMLEIHLRRRVSFHEAGRLLFPDEFEVDLSERMRKVIRPLAEWLISPPVVEALNIQAATESRKSGTN